MASPRVCLQCSILPGRCHLPKVRFRVYSRVGRDWRGGLKATLLIIVHDNPARYCLLKPSGHRRSLVNMHASPSDKLMHGRLKPCGDQGKCRTGYELELSDRIATRTLDLCAWLSAKSTKVRPQVSWPNMPSRQDTSSFDRSSTPRMQWRLVIQVFFRTRHVARLSD
jgi:hypothetical protein